MRSALWQLLLVGVLLLSQYVINIAGLGDTEKEKIRYGLTLGNELVQALQSSNFSQTLEKLSKAVGPFLGVIGPLVSFVMAFFPKRKRESAELKFMKKEFKNINRRLDRIHDEFSEVRDLIKWKAVENSYAVEEKRIKAMETLLRRFIASPQQGVIRKNQITYFIMKYESNYQSSGDKLYRGMASNTHQFTKNLITASVKYTHGHLRKVQHFMKGIVQLLLISVEIELAYYEMKGFKQNVQVQQNMWTGRLKHLSDIMSNVSMELRKKWYVYCDRDIPKFIDKKQHLSNNEFSQALHKMLQDKYDFFEWMTMVSKDTQRCFSLNVFAYCERNGRYEYWKYGKRIIAVPNRWQGKQGGFHIAHQARNDMANVKSKLRGFPLSAYDFWLTWEKHIGGLCKPYLFVCFAYGQCDIGFTGNDKLKLKKYLRLSIFGLSYGYQGP